jgi:hypothetical protein
MFPMGVNANVFYFPPEYQEIFEHNKYNIINFVNISARNMPKNKKRNSSDSSDSDSGPEDVRPAYFFLNCQHF